jgi:hypothetical protein
MSKLPFKNVDRLKPFLEFRKALIAVEESALQNLETDDEQLWYDTLVLLHSIKGDVASMFTQYSNLLANKIETDEVTASNGQKIEKKSAFDRKGWKHEDLASEVLRRLNDLSVDMDTGEVIMSASEVAMKLLDYVQPSYWRIKELSKLGINADQYCEVGELKTSIIVRKEQS